MFKLIVQMADYKIGNPKFIKNKVEILLVENLSRANFPMTK